MRRYILVVFILLYSLLQLYGCKADTADPVDTGSDKPVKYIALLDQALQTLKRGTVSGFETMAYTDPPGLYRGGDSFPVRTDPWYGRHYLRMLESPGFQAVVHAAMADSVVRNGEGLGCFVIMVSGDLFSTPSYSLVAVGVYGQDGGVVFGGRIDSVNHVGAVVSLGPIDSVKVVRTNFSSAVAHLADSIASLELRSYDEGNGSPGFFAVFANRKGAQFTILRYPEKYHLVDSADAYITDMAQHHRRVVLNAVLWNIIKRAQPSVSVLPDDRDKEWMLP